MTLYPYPPFFITLSFGMISFTYKKEKSQEEAKSKKYFQRKKEKKRRKI